MQIPWIGTLSVQVLYDTATAQYHQSMHAIPGSSIATFTLLEASCQLQYCSCDLAAVHAYI